MTNELVLHIDGTLECKDIDDLIKRHKNADLSPAVRQSFSVCAALFKLQERIEELEYQYRKLTEDLSKRTIIQQEKGW
jgi:hypothetical protein